MYCRCDSCVDNGVNESDVPLTTRTEDVGHDFLSHIVICIPV